MALPQDSSVLLVGHEPELSNLLACLLPPTNQKFSFSKAGIACMEPWSDGWRLLWHYRYKQLLARK
jgi:phosphohistidine phosphatase SixA